MNPYVRVLQTYMIALGKSDYTTIKSLFAPGGLVKSPFLGEMSAELFFDRLGEASAKNVITPIDIFLSNSGEKHATAYFQYEWTVSDGSKQKVSSGTIPDSVSDDALRSGYYAFGANQLDVISALDRMLKYLEQHHDLVIANGG